MGGFPPKHDFVNFYQSFSLFSVSWKCPEASSWKGFISIVLFSIFSSYKISYLRRGGLIFWSNSVARKVRWAVMPTNNNNNNNINSLLLLITHSLDFNMTFNRYVWHLYLHTKQMSRKTSVWVNAVWAISFLEITPHISMELLIQRFYLEEIRNEK